MTSHATELFMCLDESGTPATGTEVDRHFVIGGVVGRGSPAEADAVGRRLKVVLQAGGVRLGTKGRKYDIHALRLVASFIADEDLLPIGIHSALDASDLAALDRKVALIRGTHPNRQVVSRAHYVWLLQVGNAIAPSIVATAIPRFGPVSGIEIRIDRYGLPLWVDAIVEQVVRRYLDPEFVDARIGLTPPGRVLLAAIRSQVGYQADDPTSVRLRRTLNGGLGILADVVAAMYRRALAGEADAGTAWAELVSRTHARWGRVPDTVGRDVTQDVRLAIGQGLPEP